MSDAVAPQMLRSFVERIERLEEEKASLSGDLKEVYAEAKSQGFDTRILRKVIARRKRDAAELREEEEIMDLYLEALGMLSDTPLGEAATVSAIDAHRKAKADGPRGVTVTAAEAGRLADLTGDHLGKRKGKGSLKRQVGTAIEQSLRAMGTPTPLTEEEKAKGYSAAFVGKDGNRMAMGVNMKVPG